MVLVLGLVVSFTMGNETYSEHSTIVGPTFRPLDPISIRIGHSLLG